MNKILFVGNGFDLAHGLKTNYNQFLKVMKDWGNFYAGLERVQNGKDISETHPFFDYLYSIKEVNMENIQKLGHIIFNNSWCKYFCGCEAEIDGWIDFEREIYPVLEVFEIIFNADCTTYSDGRGIASAYISSTLFNTQQIRILQLWTRYVNASSGSSISVNSSFVSMQYGILKKRILQSLREEFEEFIKAFEIYLLEVVHKNKDIKLLNQIKEIGVDYLISLNYTLTEKLYEISEEKTHHIHGKIRENVSIGINNMVVGVNDKESQNMDFIYFVKYFQRIQKSSGIRYKDFVNKIHKNELGETIREDYILYIYGHSLDETDSDILKYIIGEKKTDNEINFKPNKIVIFYYDETDYEQKVINLIKLYGRTIVEKYMERKRIQFVKTTCEVWSNNNST